MAVTAIWDVRDSLKRVVDYVTNPLKTKNLNYKEYKFSGLENVIDYTIQDSKTERQYYVTGINCEPDTAYSEMVSTKKRFLKEEGILAYHGYQSFAKGEVTAETAHQIGIELAEKLWGERFEVIVTTHLDKEHFHNHFVINSVSFKDGYRYYDNKATYKKMREESDRLCRKYTLSIVDSPKGKGHHYSEWKADREKKATWRSLIRCDVDEAIRKSMTYSQFIRFMESLGYEVRTDVKHLAVRPKGKERYVRLRSLSQDGRYEEDAIKQRILSHSMIPFKNLQGSETKIKYKGSLDKARKLKGFRALYFYYMYYMGILPKHAPNRKRVHFLLKEDLRYMDKITKETTLLCRKKIDSLEDLEQCESATKTKMESLIRERRCVYNRIRRCRNSDTKEKLQNDVQTLTEEIKNLRKEVMLYEGIRKRSEAMKEKLTIIKEEERKEREEHDNWRGNSRSGRENVASRN